MAVIIVVEVLSALWYFLWGAPLFSTKHLDLETSVPVAIVVISVLMLAMLQAVSMLRKRDLWEIKRIMISIFAWGMMLLLIGWNTACPACLNSAF